MSTNTKMVNAIVLADAPYKSSLLHMLLSHRLLGLLSHNCCWWPNMEDYAEHIVRVI